MKATSFRATFLIICIFLLWGGSSFAAETATGSAHMGLPLGGGSQIVKSSEGKLSERIRYVPFSDLKDVLLETPKSLLISRDLYENMKQAKEAYLAKKPDSPLPRLEDDFCFGKAEYIGKIFEEFGRFEATILFEVPNDRWVLLPLPSGDIGIEEATLDGKAVGVVTEAYSGIQDEEAPKGKVAVLQRRIQTIMPVRKLKRASRSRQGRANEFLIAVRGPSKHTLKVTFAVPLVDDPEKSEITFRIPRVPTNSFSVSIGKPGQYSEVDRSEGTESKDANGKETLVSGLLGPTDRFTMRWAPKTYTPTEEQPPETASDTGKQEQTKPVQIPKIIEPPKVFADSFTLVSFGEGFIRNESLIKLNITRSAKGQISFAIPKGTDFLEVRSDRLDSQKVEPCGTFTRIICRLNSQVQSQIEFFLVTETKMTDTSQKLSAPIHWVEDTERDRGFIGVEARTSIEIRKIEKDPGSGSSLEVSSVDPSELPSELSTRAIRPILLAYRYNFPPVQNPILIDVIRHKDIPVLTSVVDKISATTLLGDDGTSITCLDFMIKNNGQQYLETGLPSGSEIISAHLDGNPVKPGLKKDAPAPRPEEVDKEDHYLVPLGRSRSSGASLGAFPLRLVYRSQVPRVEFWQRFRFRLPTFDIPVSRLEWLLYTPDKYSVFLRKSDLDQTERKIDFILFQLVSALFEMILSPAFLVLFFGLILFFSLIKYFSNMEPSVRRSPGILEYGLIFAGIAVVAIAALTSSGGSVSSMFGTISSKLQSADARVYDAPSRYPGSPPAPALEMAQSDGSYDRDEISSKEEQKLDYSAGKKGDYAKNRLVSKSEMVDKVGRRLKAGRDAGALPVDMRIPTTASSWFYFRNVVMPQETTIFHGFIVWQPIRTLFSLGLAVAGFIVFMIILWMARGRHAILASLIFTVYSITLILLEELVPHSQEPGVRVFIFCFMLTIAYRCFSAFRTWQKGLATTAAVLLLGLISCPPANAAENKIDPRIEQIIDVYIPYSQLGDRLPKDSNLVFLKYDEYKYLRDLGIPDPDPSAWMPPVSVTYLSGEYDGKIVEDRVVLKTKFEINLLGKGFKKVFFPTDKVGVRSLMLNGEPAILTGTCNQPGINDQEGQAGQPGQTDQNILNAQRRQMTQQMAIQQMAMPNNSANLIPFQQGFSGKGFIVTDREGPATIEAELVKDLFSKVDTNAKVEGFEIPLPSFSLARFKLTVNRPDQVVEITPSAMTKCDSSGTATLVLATLQPSVNLKVEWRDRVQAPPQPPEEVATEAAVQPAIPQEAKGFVDHEVLFSISEGVIEISDQVRMNVEQSPAGEFLFRVPAGAEVIEVTGTDLANWVCRDASGTMELKVTLKARRLNQVTFKIDMERQTPAISGEFPLDIPFLVSFGPKGIIERQKGYFGIESREGLEVKIKQTDPATRIDPQELPPQIRNSVQGFMAHAFKFLKEINPVVGITKHQNVEVSTAQIDGAIARSLVTKEGKLLTRVDLQVRNNNNQFLVLEQTSSSSRLLSALVNGEPVKPGVGHDKEIYVPMIRSPKVGKSLQPFGVVMIFEDKVADLKHKGRFTLRLPSLSLDVSEVNWQIDANDGFTMVKTPGDFRAGWGNIPPIPGQVYGDSGRFSNVMTQSVMTAPTSESRSDSEGLLPVNMEIPTTANTLRFNKKIVTSKGPPTQMQLIYFKDTILRVLCLVISLLIGIILAMTIFGLAGGHVKSAIFGFIVLGFFIGATLIGDSEFGEYIPFLGQVRKSLEIGLKTGIVMILAWIVLAGLPPAEIKKEKKPVA